MAQRWRPQQTKVVLGSVSDATSQQTSAAQQAPHYREPKAPQYDGKTMRTDRPALRKTVDCMSTVINYWEGLVRHHDWRDLDEVAPTPSGIKDLLPPIAWDYNPMSSICSRYVHTSINKVRYPVNVVTWTPEGRRVVTGSSSGEFTLWNGREFNFETILQAHESDVRSMVWSNNGSWMVSGDDRGSIKYWQSNMNNVKAFQAHNEPIREISFAPSDVKFATASDDRKIRIWDFMTCQQDQELTGHGWDVKTISWHPQKSLIASGSKDHKIKFWDPKAGRDVKTLNVHKEMVRKVCWNENGNWLVTASRDQTVKVLDIRNLDAPLHNFRGHRKEVTSIAWHPYHEELFASGDSEGEIIFWLVGNEEPAGHIYGAHDSSVWSLAWHPVGHLLCSGSNDHTTRFWSRSRPGDSLKDKYNIPPGRMPRTGTGDMREERPPEPDKHDYSAMAIPGLDMPAPTPSEIDTHPLMRLSGAPMAPAPALMHREQPKSMHQRPTQPGNQRRSNQPLRQPPRQPMPQPYMQGHAGMGAGGPLPQSYPYAEPGYPPAMGPPPGYAHDVHGAYADPRERPRDARNAYYHQQPLMAPHHYEQQHGSYAQQQGPPLGYQQGPPPGYQQGPPPGYQHHAGGQYGGPPGDYGQPPYGQQYR